MIPTDRNMANASNQLSYRANSSLITINTSDLNHTKENNDYIASEKFTTITGTLDKFLLDAKSFVIEIKNSYGDIVLSRKIQITNHWAVKKIGLYLGRNLVTLTAIKNNIVYTKQITIFNLDKKKMKDLDIDVSDTDADGVINYIEDIYHSNKNNTDSDQDGLNDYEEIVILGTNPITKDTDQRRTHDYDADQDGDSLTNGYELNNDLDPASKDTDSDDLHDNDEIKLYRTNPRVSDTDKDGAKDGWEVINGFDPLEFNAIFNIKEVSGEITEYNPVIASLELNVPGDQITTLNIKRVYSADNPLISPSIPGYLGSAYDFGSSGNLDKAVITFMYDKCLGCIGQDFQPRIYCINEQDGLLEELPDQTVEDGYVKVTVIHLSKYLLLNKVEFDKAWEVDMKAPIITSDGDTNIDVAFVVDVSGSMANYSRLTKAKIAVNNFTSSLNDEDHAALVTFSSASTIATGLTADKSIIESSVNNLIAKGYGTAIYKGFGAAIDLLSENSRSYGYKMIIILTDGIDEPIKKYDAYYAPLVSKAVDNNIIVYTIGTGNTDASILTKIANATGGSYYAASSSDVIIDSFATIRGETVDLKKDMNQDGISDYYNQLILNGDLRLSNGSDELKGIDFNYDKNGNISDDYDGDGLKNGQELKITLGENGRVFLLMYSDPMMVHSDYDQIDDYHEYLNGSNPLIALKSKHDIDYLMNHENFNYESSLGIYEEDLLNQLDFTFLVTLKSEWQMKVLNKDLLIDNIYQYTGKEDFDELILQNECLMANENLIRILSEVCQYEQDMQRVKDLKGIIKNLISDINGCKTATELSILLNTSYKAIFEQINQINSKLGRMVLYSYKFNHDKKFIMVQYSKITSLNLDRLDGKEIVTHTTDSGLDLAQSISSIAKVNANGILLERIVDTLQKLKSNNERISFRSAIEDIISILGEGYGNVLTEAIANDATLSYVNKLYVLASINPYIKAVEFAHNAYSDD